MVRLMYKDHAGCLRWPGRYGRRRRANVLHRGLDVYVHLEESGGWIRLVMTAVYPRRFPHVSRLRDVRDCIAQGKDYHVSHPHNNAASP